MANKVRNWLNKNSTLVTLAAVVVLLLSLGFIIVTQVQGPGVPEPIPVYYYDLNTGQLFSAKSNEIPPIASPSGPQPNGAPAGVRAYVFACGDCAVEKDRFIGWIEMYTPQVRAALLNPQSMAPPPDAPQAAPDPNAPPPEMNMIDFWERGHLVARILSQKEKEEAKKKAADEDDDDEDGEGAATKPAQRATVDPFGLDWVQSSSEEGFRIMQVLESRCGPEIVPQPCLPDGQ